MSNEQRRSKTLANDLEPERNPDLPTVYQIRVESHLDSDWTDWFDGLTITREDGGNTLLTGEVVDQSALYGLLKKIRDLGMSLISVVRMDPGETNVKH
jgi:hypothetical protein